ncbi:dTDP-4-dehydrorhamnose 3,5-epimerase [Candidatus Pacearchaeota archaeon]|nr:dTDP-4-dehydrorhamnose 3,5-epimerase [Candidatus Pacearchaeota archaeon]
MQIRKTSLHGVLEIIPEIYEDVRGNFFENYNEMKMQEAGISGHFPLEFQSTSKKGVIRGMHFQKKPFAQCKLVRVVNGKVLDVVVDIRKNSPTYGKWISVLLSADNKVMLWIPEGFAHGFLALEDNTLMLYKLTNHYDSASLSGILWNDPALAIDWQLEKHGIEKVIVSEKDKKLSLLRDVGALF